MGDYNNPIGDTTSSMTPSSTITSTPWVHKLIHTETIPIKQPKIPRKVTHTYHLKAKANINGHTAGAELKQKMVHKVSKDKVHMAMNDDYDDYDDEYYQDDDEYYDDNEDEYYDEDEDEYYDDDSEYDDDSDYDN
eukprot:242257_1